MNVDNHFGLSCTQLHVTAV